MFCEISHINSPKKSWIPYVSLFQTDVSLLFLNCFKVLMQIELLRKKIEDQYFVL